MTRSLRHFPLIITCSGLIFAALPNVSHAQSAREQEAQAEAAEAAQKAEAIKQARRAAPPAANPGAAADEETEEEHMNNDMEPTAALFAAINRGSTSAAKESINRGADLSGRNILGQTPLEMSIDMNRNAITFLLLSMRGQDSHHATTVSSRSATVAEDDTSEESKHVTRPKKATPQKKPLDTPGGKPHPQSGFLGFTGS